MLNFPERDKLEKVARELITDTTSRFTRQKFYAKYHNDETFSLDQESQREIPVRNGEVMEESPYPIMILARKDLMYCVYGHDTQAINPYEILFTGVGFHTHPEELHSAMADFLSSREIRSPSQFHEEGGDYALFKPEIYNQTCELDQRDDIFFYPPAKIINILIRRIYKDGRMPIAMLVPKGITIGDNSLEQIKGPRVPIYTYQINKLPNQTMVGIEEISRFWEP